MASSPCRLPPFEEWVVHEHPQDLTGELMEAIREDVERVVDRLNRRGGGK